MFDTYVFDEESYQIFLKLSSIATFSAVAKRQKCIDQSDDEQW